MMWRMLVPAGNGKVEISPEAYITRVLLTIVIYPGNIYPLKNGGLAVNPGPDTAYIAFEDDRRIAAGDLREGARVAKQILDRRKDAAILVFDGVTSGPVEIDFRGSVADVQARLPEAVGAVAGAGPPTPRGPGPPDVGVGAREVKLLPRHWGWVRTTPTG